MSTRTFPLFEHVNYERLMLAVCLAKRDVAKLRATEDNSFSSSIQSEDQDFLSKHTPSTKSCLAKESKYSINNGSKNFGSSKKTLSTSAKKPCKPFTILSSSHSLPARSDSPPVRDTDNWIPSRARPLHEPTEKQIKTAQESRLRQLDAKIAQYAAALDEIQFSRKAVTSDRSKTQSFKMINRTCGNSISSNRNSLIRSRSVPMRSRSTKPTLNSRKFVDKNSYKNVIPKVNDAKESQFDLSNIIPPNNSEHCEEDSKAQELWNEAVQYLCANQPDIVFLKPEETSYPDHNKPVTYSLCSTTAYNEDHNIANNDQDSNTNSIVDTIEEMLRQIDDIEQEENIIRHRWSTFLHTNQLNQTTDLPSNSMKSPSLSICRKFEHPPKKEDLYPTVIMKDGNKMLEKASIVFSKMETEPKSNEVKSINPYSSNPVNQLHLTLRLPTKLHRNLLKYHSEKSKVQTNLWSDLNLLTSYKYKQLKYPVRICEMLVNEIFDDVIDELFDQIDNISSNVVNQLIRNEIYSQNSIDNSILENLNDISVITQTNEQNYSWVSENIGEINNYVDKIPNDFNKKYCAEQSTNPYHSDACQITNKSSTSTNQNDSDSTTDYSSHFEQYSTSSCSND